MYLGNDMCRCTYLELVTFDLTWVPKGTDDMSEVVRVDYITVWFWEGTIEV